MKRYIHEVNEGFEGGLPSPASSKAGYFRNGCRNLLYALAISATLGCATERPNLLKDVPLAQKAESPNQANSTGMERLSPSQPGETGIPYRGIIDDMCRGIAEGTEKSIPGGRD